MRAKIQTEKDRKPAKSRSSSRSRKPKGPISPTIQAEPEKAFAGETPSETPETRRDYAETTPDSGYDDWANAAPASEAATPEIVIPAPLAADLAAEAPKPLKGLWIEFGPEYAAAINNVSSELGIDARAFIEAAVARAIQLHLLDAEMMEGKRKGSFGGKPRAGSEGGQKPGGASAELTEHEALLVWAFYCEYGKRSWRRIMAALWDKTEADNDEERVLMNLRNTHGLDWLSAYTPKSPCRKAKK